MQVLLVTNMYPTPEKPAFGTFVKDQVESLRRAGVGVDVLFIDGRMSRLNYVGGIFRFWWKLLRKRYDFIHAHYLHSGLIARFQFTLPVITTYHGAEVTDHSPGWIRWAALHGRRFFKRIIVVSRPEKERILGTDPESKVVVIPCGVNLAVFRPMPVAEARSRLGLPAQRPLVLWAGEYWQYEKRFELVEESMTLLKEINPEAELILVADKPHEIIPVYMNACDVLLLTSRSEGSPMVIKEAMACNLPIVSTDVGDVAEVIGDTEGCFLAEPDAKELADKLHQILQSRRRTDGREKIQHMGAGPIARRLIAVYNELCPPDRRMEIADRG